jgi:hypothetical protein
MLKPGCIGNQVVKLVRAWRPFLENLAIAKSPQTQSIVQFRPICCINSTQVVSNRHFFAAKRSGRKRRKMSFEGKTPLNPEESASNCELGMNFAPLKRQLAGKESLFLLASLLRRVSSS